MVIRLKRASAPAAEEDGDRILVDRLWPRGLSRGRGRVDRRVKDAGTSPALRRRFGSDPGRREEVSRRYLDELREVLCAHSVATLLYAARDVEQNNAVILREVPEES